MIRRGEVWWADPFRMGVSPWLTVSTDEANSYGAYVGVPVVAHPDDSLLAVGLGVDDPVSGALAVEQVMQLRFRWFQRRAGHVTPLTLARVDAALQLLLGPVKEIGPGPLDL